MKPNQSQKSPDDVEMFREAYAAALAVYEPLGFGSPCEGELYHPELNFSLLPFHWRVEAEEPVQFALRSAYEAGVAQGKKER